MSRATNFETVKVLTVAMEGDRVELALSYAAERVGVPSLNEKQKEAVRAFVGGKDVFVSLPTGFGKSVCFQSIPFVLDYLGSSQSSDVEDRHIALVVEPTAAIMRHQVSKLHAKNISAAFINHEQQDGSVKQAVVEGKTKFVYIPPESLSIPKYRDMLYSDAYQQRLAVFAVDEVHCILTWANFRRQFQHLGEIRAVLDVKVMALTATCTPADRQTIMSNLSMEEATLVQHSADHPNVFFVVREMPGDFSQWQETLDEDMEMLKTLGIHAERKVIYCRSIEMACRLYEYYEDCLGGCAYHHPKGSLIPSNRLIAMYHSESATSVKTTVSGSLLDPNGVIRRVFATQSLGMGIDCPNIREVIHWDVPRSLEDYYQECGRAGRDGMPARATLLYASRQLHEALCNKTVISYCTCHGCYRKAILDYFCIETESESSILCCSNCNRASYV